MNKYYLVFFLLILSRMNASSQDILDNLKTKVQNKVLMIEAKEWSWSACITGEYPTFLGQGVIISSDGFILTAKHVIEGCSYFNVFFIDEKQNKHSFEAKIIAEHPSFDLAILKIDFNDLYLESRGLPYLDFEEKSIQLQQWVFLGYYCPKENDIILRGGQVLKLLFSNNPQNPPEVYTSCASYPGDSGGPWLSENGNVLGIHLGAREIPFLYSRFLPYTAFKEWLEGVLF